MPKITDYKIVVATGSRLAGAVKEAISEGWEPVGGPCVQGDMVSQAMVIYDYTESDLIAEQINAIHSTQVIDIPMFFKEWRDHQSYPRQVKVTS